MMKIRLALKHAGDWTGEFLRSLDALSGSGAEMDTSHLWMRLDRLQAQVATLEREMQRLQRAMYDSPDRAGPTDARAAD